VGQRRLALYYFPARPLTETHLGASLGDGATLGRVATLPSAQAGDVLPVVLYWQARQPLPADYYVFVHLLDAGGKRVTQSDGQPALWTRPTSTWQPGERITDRHALSLPADLAPGDYVLIAGLYLPESGERLTTEGGESYVTLGTVRIAGNG
jgi:hypothetical protein